jgi:hypothetical protein
MEDVLPDVEPVVRQALMEQVPMVTRYFIETGQESGYTIVLHILLPMVAELTTDRNAQVPILYLHYRLYFCANVLPGTSSCC